MRRELADTMLDNFTRRLHKSNVRIALERNVSFPELKDYQADAIILAIGSRPYIPHFEGVDDPRVMYVDNLFAGNVASVGERALIFDYLADWSGVEAAIYLAENGRDMTLMTARLHIAESVHQYLRNEYLKRLYMLKVKMEPHPDFGGLKNNQVIKRNVFSYEIEHLQDWDTIVLCAGRVPITDISEQAMSLAPIVKPIGDCLAPRTIEEATYEGLMAALEI